MTNDPKRQAVKDKNPQRVVLAPDERQDLSARSVQWVDGPPARCVLLVDELQFSRYQQVALTEPEALALRDWLCEQFGRPTATYEQWCGDSACQCCKEKP
jgi:hypothetical protein